MSQTHDRLEEFRTGQSIPVALPSLEKELASMWRSVAGAPGEGEPREVGEAAARPVTRACLWNLIVRTAGGSAFRRAKDLVDAISPSLPARVLVLDADPARPTKPIEAWIEANWHSVGGGAKQIGSDEVTLAASGDSVDDLAQVVRALIVPDVPVAAIWHGLSPMLEGRGASLDAELCAAANRVIVAADGGEASLRAMGALLGGRAPNGGGASRTCLAPRSDLTSLSWLRTAAWRQLLASLFDAPTPDEEAFAVEDVSITCGADHVDAALLYLSWLATRLGWQEGRRITQSERRYQFDAPGHLVTARIVDDDGHSDDVLAKVELHTSTGPYVVTRHDTSSVVLETPEIARKQPRRVSSDDDLWLDALGARGRDPLFIQALQVAVALSG